MTLAGKEVAVVGDLTADVTIRGDPAGVVREDSAHRLIHRDEVVRAGRAGSAARAIAKLGGIPRLVGVVGDDPRGDALFGSLEGARIGTTRVKCVEGFPTPVRFRIVVGGGHRAERLLVRVDHEPRGKPPPGASGVILGHVRDLAAVAGAFLFVDGGHGIASPGAAALVPGLRVAVSADRISGFKGFDAIVLDEESAFRATGKTVTEGGSARAAAKQILTETEAKHLVLVRGRLGALWFAADGNERIFAAAPAETEVTAGALALALAAGLDPEAAAEAAVRAAGA